jgi:hypothetical protein
MPVYQSKKAKARSLMSNSRGLGGVGGYFGVQVAGVAAPGAGSVATPTAMAELSMPPTLPPSKGKPMSMIMEATTTTTWMPSIGQRQLWIGLMQ